MSKEANTMLSAMKEVLYKRTIYNIEKGIKDSHNLKAALEAVLDVVVPAVKAEAGTLWFYDRYKDGRIRPYVLYGGGDLGDFSLGLGEGVAGQVIESGKATIVEDCTKDPRWQGKADAKTGFVTKSMIVAPLKTEEYTFACIQIINKTDGTFYDGEDFTFAKNLATFTSEMFQKLGYIGNNIRWSTDNSSVSFSELVNCEYEEDLITHLKSVREFAALKEKEQKAIIKYMKKICAVVEKSRENEDKASK